MTSAVLNHAGGLICFTDTVLCQTAHLSWQMNSRRSHPCSSSLSAIYLLAGLLASSFKISGDQPEAASFIFKNADVGVGVPPVNMLMARYSCHALHG
jgi:hypothetical protein